MTKRTTARYWFPEDRYLAILAKAPDDREITVNEGTDDEEKVDLLDWFFVIYFEDQPQECKLSTTDKFSERSNAGKWSKGILGTEDLPREFDDDDLVDVPIYLTLTLEKNNAGEKVNKVAAIKRLTNTELNRESKIIDSLRTEKVPF